MIKVFWPEKPCRLRQASPRWARVSGVAARCMIWANMHSTSRRNSSFRWLIAAMVGAFAFVSYVQRMNVSVAPELMMPDLGLTKSQMGQIFSSFLVGYALFQVPAGRLGDAIGARITLSLAALVWGCTTLLTGVVPKMFGVGTAALLISLGVLRFLLGASEAATFRVGSRDTPMVAAAGMGHWQRIHDGWQFVRGRSNCAAGFLVDVAFWLASGIFHHVWTRLCHCRIVVLGCNRHAGRTQTGKCSRIGADHSLSRDDNASPAHRLFILAQSAQGSKHSDSFSELHLRGLRTIRLRVLAIHLPGRGTWIQYFERRSGWRPALVDGTSLHAFRWTCLRPHHRTSWTKRRCASSDHAGIRVVCCSAFRGSQAGQSSGCRGNPLLKCRRTLFCRASVLATGRPPFGRTCRRRFWHHEHGRHPGWTCFDLPCAYDRPTFRVVACTW